MLSRDIAVNDRLAAALALGPPAVWSLHLLVCYFIVSWGGADNTTLRWLLTAVTLVALSIIGAVGIVAARHLRSRSGESDASLLLYRLALGFCVLFAIATIFTAFPVYALRDINGA